MRDEKDGTRYFTFLPPSVEDGEIDSVWGVRRVVLGAEKILEAFDCAHHHFIQGACARSGLIYSTEGFSDHEVERPAIRVVDPCSREQITCVDLISLGYTDEPEMIDFYGDTCLYSDAHGNLYELEFE